MFFFNCMLQELLVAGVSGTLAHSNLIQCNSIPFLVLHSCISVLFSPSCSLSLVSFSFSFPRVLSTCFLFIHISSSFLFLFLVYVCCPFVQRNIPHENDHPFLIQKTHFSIDIL